jgi:hypothetical protein
VPYFGRRTRFSSGTEVQQITAPRNGVDKSVEPSNGTV